jgi:hypothetical protein
MAAPDATVIADWLFVETLQQAGSAMDENLMGRSLQSQKPNEKKTLTRLRWSWSATAKSSI